jgi:L-rhamnose mutarotase
MDLVQIVDLQPDCYDEYVEAHRRVPVEAELKAVGLTNIRVHVWRAGDKSACRLILSATWTATQEDESFEDAMERYQTMPGVKDWEAWMDRLKAHLPGQIPGRPPKWERCECVYMSANANKATAV